MTSAHLLNVAIAAVALCCLTLGAVVVVVKLRRRRRQRRRAALVAPHRRHLIAVAAGEDQDGAGRSALGAVSPAPAQQALVQTIAGVLGKVRGLPAEQLVGVLDDHGALAAARADLGHRSPVRRAQAAQLLGLSRDPAVVGLLVAALADRAGEVRASAAYGLGLVGDPAAAAPLLRAVAAPEGGLPAGLVADALLEMGVGISDAVAGALADPDPRTRTVAAHLCGTGSFTRPLPLLRRLLADDPDLTVRETCAEALGSIGRTEDAEALARHTEAVHPLPLRRVCAAALGQLGDPVAIPTLAALLHDRDPRLAELAAASLVRLGASGEPTLAAAGEAPAVRSALALASLQGTRS